MPDKPLAVATYAAGASLAAITLVYVFGPTFFLDDRTPTSRKQGVVGLANPANDCFINSVLQALAGLGDLRVYLIQELHRRKQDDPGVYVVSEEDKKGKLTPNQLRRQTALLEAVVSQSLKEMLDRLNERPLYPKTISANPLIRSLEYSFGTRLNRQQQDAQELLQILLERLLDECQAGVKAQKKWQEDAKLPTTHSVVGRDQDVATLGESENISHTKEILPEAVSEDKFQETIREPRTQTSFPFEGKLESQVECQTCSFRPKPNVSTFVSLTLNVPQVSSTTLDQCFDGLMKLEYIDDYKCDRCRLEHALHAKQLALEKYAEKEKRRQLKNEITAVQEALEEDPEQPSSDCNLPDSKSAPSRRTSKHTRISVYPKILAIHLSRSIFDPGSYSMKNTARVSFDERVTLGGFDRKRYRLLALIAHHGGHHSGHYETFRRQIMDSPYLPPSSLDPSRNSVPGEAGAVAATATTTATYTDSITTPSTPSSHLPSPVFPPANPSIDTPSSFSQEGAVRDSTTSSLAPAKTASLSQKSSSKVATPAWRQSLSGKTLTKRKKKHADKWWRMSDEKVKECRTHDVLGMQKEAYLLFYEMLSPEEAEQSS